MAAKARAETRDVLRLASLAQSLRANGDEPSALREKSLHLLSHVEACLEDDSDAFLFDHFSRECHAALSEARSQQWREMPSAVPSITTSFITLEEVLQMPQFEGLAGVSGHPQEPSELKHSTGQQQFLQAGAPPNLWEKPKRMEARGRAPDVSADMTHETSDLSNLPSNSTSFCKQTSLEFIRRDTEDSGSYLTEEQRHKRPRPGHSKWNKQGIQQDSINDDRQQPQFMTAYEKLGKGQKLGQNPKSDGFGEDRQPDPRNQVPARRGVRNGFVPPMRAGSQKSGGGTMARPGEGKDSSLDDATQRCLDDLKGEDGELPERLKNIEPRLIEHVYNEILTRDTRTTWDDIAGLEHAKDCVTETIIWPLKRPDLFQGTRAPPSGLLLFGPPGTGKTMIGRAIAGEIDATFFSISASSLTSKWIGEGEKLVRALFVVASCKSPAVIFIDEIDSLLSQRKSDGEHESSRRMKTQFLVEMEGCQGSAQQLLVIGATNRPQELDEAARRRLSKRLYIPLPESVARVKIVQHLLNKDGLLSLSEADLEKIASKTAGYSGSDMAHLVKEASMVPIREAMRLDRLTNLRKEEIRPISLEDFEKALHKVRPTVAPEELTAYQEWNHQYGSEEMA